MFDPPLPYRRARVPIASGLTAAFLVAGIGSYRWLRGERAADVGAAMKAGVYPAALLIAMQIFAGDPIDAYRVFQGKTREPSYGRAPSGSSSA